MGNTDIAVFAPDLPVPEHVVGDAPHEAADVEGGHWLHTYGPFR